MRLVQYLPLNVRERGSMKQRLKVGIVNGENNVIPLPFGGTMRDLLAEAEHMPNRIGHLYQQALQMGECLPLDTVELASPLTDPEKLLFIGLNYADHAQESGMAVPEKPVLFGKFANALTGHEAIVDIPEEVSQCDYEVELAVVIGKTIRDVTEEQAMDAIFGYTIVNDVSARDIQLSEGQWMRGKAIDDFAPMGPWIVTADAISDPGQLEIALRLNGKTMQSSNTRQLIFSVPYLIVFLSRTMTLKPGDVISTGTPPGVGMGFQPPVWLQDGDVTEAEIAGIGTLTNSFRRNR
ncbi:fumarylacetoacetate hydrolase family protein [Paenibacillus senegalensis]|uniref:fumarylacetoacetate hydrolase family protein n=1 Tax=Paenibacillus senegalensis TaxID=1465766 RepID=UPI000287CD6A|nr:fumarylacetoacetate hydrolase family protein [Paenibacillus senegalensis]